MTALNHTATFRFPSTSLAALPWRTFQPGDHVRVFRGAYWHHAIYVENGWLIEFGSGVAGGGVAPVHWRRFSRGQPVRLVTRGGQLAVQRAATRLGRADFNLVSRNCEHFANWCATGRWESSQVAFAGGVVCVAALVAILGQPKTRRR